MTPEDQAPQTSEAAETNQDETLLDQLDRRQNEVLSELDLLDSQINDLVTQCQVRRGQQREDEQKSEAA